MSPKDPCVKALVPVCGAIGRWWNLHLGGRAQWEEIRSLAGVALGGDCGAQPLLFLSLIPSYHEVSSFLLRDMLCCHRAKATGPNDHGLKAQKL
jgi:hypothetical protein